MIQLLGQFLNRKIINNPIFIVGQGRSGTTALVNAIGQSDKVMITPFESPVIRHYGEILYYYLFEEKEYYQQSTPISKISFKNKMKWDIFSTYKGIDYGTKLILKRLIKLDFKYLKANHWAAKIFPDFKQYQGLDALFPNAKFIYIYRNGIDQINSSMYHPSFSGHSFEYYCKYWIDHINKYSYLKEQENAIILKQEEMLHNPEVTMKNVFHFLGLADYTKASSYLTKNLIHPLNKRTVVTDVKIEIRKRKPAYLNWTKEQQNLFKEMCGQLMINLGYEMPF